MGTCVSTVLVVTTSSGPALVSLALAPGSLNATWQSLVPIAAPGNRTVGGGVSCTTTVRTVVVELPLGSVAAYLLV